MLNKIYKISSLVLLSGLPLVSYAAILGGTDTFFKAALNIVQKTLVPLVFTLGLLFFFWGITKYIWSVGSDGKEEGKKIMFWGVIALFVMSTIWGILYFIGQEIGGGIGDEYDMKIPTLKP